VPVKLLVDLMLQQELRGGRRPDYRRAGQPRVAASLRDQPAAPVTPPGSGGMAFRMVDGE
jgi:hypothetical protein